MRRCLPTETVLAFCGGFSVEASDGPAGIVETPLFPPDATAPDFLVLRVDAGSRQRRPVLPAELVEQVDPQARVVRVRARGSELLLLPEHLPLAT